MVRRINWVQALAEVFLLVVGVTLALAADAWNDARLERREESAYLQSLRRDFQETKAQLESTLDFTTKVLDNNLALIEVLSSPPGTVPDERLVELTQIAFMVMFYEPVLGTYRDLVNSGKLGLLRSDSLRLELAQFDVVFDGTRLVTLESWNQWNDLQVPYMVQNLDVSQIFGGEYHGTRFPPSLDSSKTEAFWSNEFLNILKISVISKVDMIQSGETLIRHTDAILRLIDESG